jgi:hypothetical protein
MKTIDQRMQTPGPKRGLGLTWRQIKEFCDSLNDQQLDTVATVLADHGDAYLTYAGPNEHRRVFAMEPQTESLAKGAPVLGIEEGISLE